MRGLGPIIATALVLVLSACMGGGKPSASGDPRAADPSVDGSSGSVAGIVFDEEQVPLADVAITVRDGPATQTDASGAFTINELAAGPHELRIVLAGYADEVKNVDVAAGEITQIRVELKATPINQTYHWSFSKVGVVRVGQWSLQYAQHTVNNTVLDALLCDPCAYPVALKPLIVDAVTDVLYTRALTVPYVNEYVTAVYSTPQASGSQLKLLMTHNFKPRESYQWSGVQVRELRGYETVRLEFHGPDDDPPGIVVNQKIELWQTFAQGAMLPPGYTLLPP